MTSPAEPPRRGAADEHRWIAAGFTDRVVGTPPERWDAPSPVEGWTARDVVRHLLEWFPAFLESGAGITLTPGGGAGPRAADGHGPSVDDDPVAAWQVQTDAVQSLLDDPATAGRTFSNPHTGEHPLDRAIDMFYTGDVFMHTWDLARATGQDETLDPDKCAKLLAGMEPIEDLMRSSGQYGPRVEVPPDSDVQTRMLAFIGRDPLRTQ